VALVVHLLAVQRLAARALEHVQVRVVAEPGGGEAPGAPVGEARRHLEAGGHGDQEDRVATRQNGFRVDLGKEVHGVTPPPRRGP
jgi:hypothetical protein